MLSGNLWPVHFKPLPDELLSSWFVRLASANGVKLQTLCWMLFGNERSPWNRDVDRSAPEWLLEALCHHTTTSRETVLQTTLLAYQNRLFLRRRETGHLSWVLSVRSHGMTHQGFCTQFCPVCLANDPEPYFRKAWRLVLSTYCSIHQVRLHDSCPACNLPVMYHRGDFGCELWDAKPIWSCYGCGFDLRLAQVVAPAFPTMELHVAFDQMLLSLQKPIKDAGIFEVEFYTVMHQLCRVMGMRQNRGRLQAFIAQQLGIEPISLSSERVSIEHYRLNERHHLLLCGLWLMETLSLRLEATWRAKAVRYNQLVKDFQDMPVQYIRIVKRFLK